MSDVTSILNAIKHGDGQAAVALAGRGAPEQRPSRQLAGLGVSISSDFAPCAFGPGT